MQNPVDWWRARVARRGGPDDDRRTRTRLAFWIVLGSIMGILAVSIVAISLADDKAEASRLVFASILPLLGTWVGTVIAFYFARENLQAATESTLKLSGRLTPETPVQQVMIPKGKITSHNLTTGDKAESVKLKELFDAMTSAGRLRIPILDPSGAVVYVVHDSTISRFADTVGKTTQALKDETMGDLVKNDQLKQAVTAIGVVGPNAVLADARAAMSSVPNCNDVFVTESGQKGDPIIGWLTNTDLAALE